MIIAVCDDEKKLRNDLCRLIETSLQLTGISYEIQTYESGDSLLAGIGECEPQILFLDIEMPGLNGMETAKELRKRYNNTVIIFVTAYPDFVFQGYEVHAFHYILKPYKEEKIREVLEKALGEMERMEERCFLIEQKGTTIRVPFKDIMYFKSEGRQIEVVSGGRKERFYAKLAEIEGELPDYFVRTHNRYLVNLNHVSRLEASQVRCGHENLPVSRAYKQEAAVAYAKLMLH